MSKIVFLGVEGSGKTTLTMALAKAFERHRSEEWYLKPLSRDSFRFLMMLPENLDESAFPHQTADLRELSWQVEYTDNVLTDISILDYPGEIYRLAFLDEKDERDPEAFRQKVAANKREIDTLLNSVKEAQRVFVLFNLNDAVDLAGNPRNLDAVWVTNACLHLLKKLDPRPDIQFLLTQADRYRDAGKDLSKFSLDEINLVGHDHKDVPWRFVSSLGKPASDLCIDRWIFKLIEDEAYNEFIKQGQLLLLNSIKFANQITVRTKLFGSDEFVYNHRGVVSKAIQEATVFCGRYRHFLTQDSSASVVDRLEDAKNIDQRLVALVNSLPLSSRQVGCELGRITGVLKTDWGRGQLHDIISVVWAAL